MPQFRGWPRPQDAQIRRLRGEGATWDRIAKALAVTRNAARERGRRIGAHLPPPSVAAQSMAAFLLDPCREPLPAGHPASWDMLTAGSCLEGTPYPVQPTRDLTPCLRPSVALEAERAELRWAA